MDMRHRIWRDMACTNSDCKRSDGCEFFVPRHMLQRSSLLSSVCNDERTCTWPDDHKSAAEKEEHNKKMKERIDSTKKRLGWLPE